MTTTFIQLFLTPVSFVLIPGPVVTPGLGDLAVLCEEGSSPPVGGVISANNAADVATLLADDVINAAGAAQATAAFSQNYKPSIVWFGTHTSIQLPGSALDNLLAADVPFGVVVPADVTDAGLSAVGVWLSTDGRALRYLVIAESLNSGLLTSGKPPTLSDIEQSGVKLFFGAVAQGIAGGAAGIFAGKGLSTGPAAAAVNVLGVDLPGSPPPLTAAEINFALANDAGVLLPADAGASAAERIIRGYSMYSGTVGFTAQTSLMFTLRRAEAGITAMIKQLAATAVPLTTDARGRSQVVAAITGQLNPLAEVGHYVKGASGTAPNVVNLPNGFRVTAITVGTSITALITARFGKEAETVAIAGIGSVA